MTTVGSPQARRTTPVTLAPEPVPTPAERSTGAITVALAQTAPRLGDVAWNLDRHLDLVGDARSQQAALVVFPELSLTGYFLKDLVPEVSLRVDSPELGPLTAASTEIDIVIGCVLEDDDWRCYNAALYLSGGAVSHVHRKVYLPTYGLFDEARYFSQGDRFRRFDAPLAHAHPPRPWRAGMLICEDMWHPNAAGLLARQGIDAFICPSSSPGRGVGRGMALGTANSYDAMTRTYAQLFTSYLIYVNRVGYEDGVAFWGGSRVVGPDGGLVTGPAAREEALLLAELDFATLRRSRIANPLLRDERHDVNDAENNSIRRAGD